MRHRHRVQTRGIKPIHTSFCRQTVCSNRGPCFHVPQEPSPRNPGNTLMACAGEITAAIDSTLS